jgi:ParB/RepB/Spo0J family partition protein
MMARLKDLGSVKDSFLIPIGDIEPGKNIRLDFSSVPGLAVSMFNFGQLVPIEVLLSESGKKAIIADGERRYRAALYVNEHYAVGDASDKKITHLQCVAEPRGTDELTRVLRQLEHNDQSQPLSATERAKAYKLLVDSGWSVADIAKKAGKSTTAIRNVLDILDAPTELQDAVKGGRMSASVASKAAKASPETRARAVEKAVKGERVTVADVTEHGVLSVGDIKKAIKKADGYIYAAKMNTQEKARWEGVKFGLETALGMHEFVEAGK